MRLIHVNNALIKTADEIILYKQVFISLYLKKKRKTGNGSSHVMHVFIFWRDRKCRLVRTTDRLLSLAEINVSVLGSLCKQNVKYYIKICKIT